MDCVNEMIVHPCSVEEELQAWNNSLNKIEEAGPLE